MLNALNILSVAVAYVAAPEASRPLILKAVAIFVSVAAAGTYIAISVLLLRQKKKAVPTSREETLNAFQNPRWEAITGYRFSNQSVDLDGKSFRDCSFTNVTLMYHGTAPTEFANGCTFDGSVSVDTRNPALITFSRLQRLIRAIPGARAKEGSLDAKGNVLQDRFEIKAIEPPTPPTLAERTFVLCKEMRSYLKNVETEPQYSGKGSSEDLAKWLSEVLFPWQEKFHAGYMLRFNARVVAIRHELAERGLRSGEIDSVVSADVHNAKMVNPMIEALITLAAKLDE